jgi:hypothetical protein
VSPRVRDAAVGASIVGVGIAGLISGVLGHPAAMSLAVTVLFVLVPPFVRALERQITAQGMAKEPLTLFYRRIPWFVGVGVVVAVGSVISAKAYFEQEPGRAVTEILSGAAVLLAGIRLLRWTRGRA